MKLSSNEKRLLKIMATVLVMSGIVLYFVFQPPEIKTIPSNVDEVSKSDNEQTSNVSNTARRSSRGGSSGGGNSGSSGSVSISVSTFESHDSALSCWVLIKGEVYDITGYLQNINDPERAALFCGTFGFKEGYLGDSEEKVNEVIRQSIKMGTIG